MYTQWKIRLIKQISSAVYHMMVFGLFVSVCYETCKNVVMRM